MRDEIKIRTPHYWIELPADLPVSVEIVHFERESRESPAAWAARCGEHARSIVR